MSFRIQGLPAENFEHLFALSDEELAQRGAVRRIVDDRWPGYPCRVSLEDSKPDDELLLINYEHLPVESPYRMRFAVYVRKGDATYDRIDEVPRQLRKRMLAVRAFDSKGMMVAFDLVNGDELEGASASCSDAPSRSICTSTTRRPAATKRASTGCDLQCCGRAKGNTGA